MEVRIPLNDAAAEEQIIGWAWELGISREATGQIYRWEPQIGFHSPKANRKPIRNVRALYARAAEGKSNE